MKKHTAVIVSGTAAAIMFIGGVASAQSVAFPSQMGVGAQGSEVTSLQTWLENNGYYSGPITGYYGSLTMAAVEQYQLAHSISATGYVGPLTLEALNTQASGSTTVSSNPTLLAQLEAELNSLLAQIQALENQTVTGIPSAMSASVQTNENVSVGAILGASGTGPFTYSLTSNPINGTITSFNSTTGAFTYTPNNNYTGNDSFSYTVRNSVGVSSPMTITLSVEPSSTGAPVAQAFSFSTANNNVYNGTLSATGNSPYTFSIAVGPSHGTISNLNSSTGAFTYTPTTNYSGSDTFTYTVSNSAGVSTPVTVTVTDGSNTNSGAPTGQTMSFSTVNGAAINGTLAASGSGPYTFILATSPSWGIISNFNTSNGTFTYIPNSGYTGTDSFTYKVSNSSGTSAAYTVNITD